MGLFQNSSQTCVHLDTRNPFVLILKPEDSSRICRAIHSICILYYLYYISLSGRAGAVLTGMPFTSTESSAGMTKNGLPSMIRVSMRSARSGLT